MPMLYNINNNILKINEDDAENIRLLKTSIKLSLEKYSKIYDTIENLLYLATFIDPRFKTLEFIGAEKRERVFTEIYKSVKHYCTVFKEKNLIIDSSNSVALGKRMKIEKQSSEAMIFGPLFEKKDEKNFNEFENYLKLEQTQVDTNPLVWWRENQHIYKDLSMIARILFAIPASSASSECLFSKAGYLLNKRRTSLNSKAVDAFLFISCNSDKL